MDTSPDPKGPNDELPELARDDDFGPPAEPCLCYCLHCGRQIMSDQMWFQAETKDGKVVGGFWMCPTPNCGGAGFTFDIFPVDPAHPANAGWHCSDDDDDDEFEDDESEDEDTDGEPAAEEPAKPESEPYDPAEPDYAETGDVFDVVDDDDLEGEEWKLGLKPGERPTASESMADAILQRDEEEKKYDMPDERPRSVERTEDDRPRPSSGEFGDPPF